MPELRIVIFGWADSVHVRRWSTGLTERGCAVRVVSLDGSPIPWVDTQIIPRSGKLSYVTRSHTAARLARSFNPDLVHVHYAGGFSLWGLRCRLCPLVVSVWGADVIDLPQSYWQRLIIGRALRKADAISATSGFLRQATEATFPATKGRVSVIHFGVTVPPEPAPLPAGPARLCFIKRHRPKYGPDILLQAFTKAREQLPDLKLTMAGEGAMTPQLERYVEQAGLRGAVDFVGFVDNRRIYSLLQEHHIMVMPSVMDSESFGVAVLEASACARPVIASRVGGVPEVVRDGETGLLTEPGDIDGLVREIVALASDRDRCKSMGLAGYDMVREAFTWEQSLDDMLAFYADTMRKRIDG